MSRIVPLIFIAAGLASCASPGLRTGAQASATLVAPDQAILARVEDGRLTPVGRVSASGHAADGQVLLSVAAAGDRTVLRLDNRTDRCVSALAAPARHADEGAGASRRLGARAGEMAQASWDGTTALALLNVDSSTQPGCRARDWISAPITNDGFSPGNH